MKITCIESEISRNGEKIRTVKVTVTQAAKIDA